MNGILTIIILMRSGQRDLGLVEADRSAEQPPYADLAGLGYFGIYAVMIVKPDRQPSTHVQRCSGRSAQARAPADRR